MKLALDHHYPKAIAVGLRDRGFDVVTAFELDWHTEDDETLLTLCAGQRRALLTNNVADFAVVTRAWQAEGRSHCGVIFASDASLPRVLAMIGTYLDRLAQIMTTHPGDNELLDVVCWL
ncbi:MAG: DUF5615 family PIN-like protein [Actinomycetes bacterium]